MNSLARTGIATVILWAIALYPSQAHLGQTHEEGAVAHERGKHRTLALAGLSAPLKILAQAQAAGSQTLSGQGSWRFKWRPDLSRVPVSEAVLAKAHGGFAVDRTVPHNQRTTMFGLPGAGQIRISPDLKKMVVVGGDPSMVNDKWNYHNATYFHVNEKAFLIWPSNNGGRVWITSGEGKLLRTFVKPPQVEGGFAPTDGEFVDGKLLVPSGYADRFIYSADPFSGTAQGVWDEHRWGGRGPKEKHGAFSTSHGITRVPHTNIVTVSDREHERLQTFNKLGHYIGGIDLEKGTMPCDVDFDDTGRFAVVGCLKGPGRSTPAPFYILENGNVLSKVTPGELGVPNATHIHNASFRVLEKANGEKQWFVLVLFWNPGGYAVLERTGS